MHSVSMIDGDETDSSQATARRIDVSDLDAIGVQEFVRTSVDTDDVSLEHRGSRTYLVVGE
ncbi:hypothetical protein [Natronosalvus vescus]|uniref:hypothetical protein n=1 Tax=Natronosalvus vescus TaxID=2953881 RepID=UPI002090BF0C|nr:hypothetical protein [Natronosalvus vescus]